MPIERRFIKGGSIRSTKGDKPGIAGVAAVYTQAYDTGYFSETIAPGAFTRALSEKQDVRCLFNHDPNQLLGRTKSGTLRMEDSPDGLKFDCDTDPNTTAGRDVPAMIDRGDVDGCSFSFNVRKDTWSDEFDDTGRYVTSHRVIDDLDLFDVGPVTYPAYTDTSVGARSNWPDGVPAEVRSHVPALRSDEEQTKKVDGESLTRDCFLLVGDPDKTATWDLPWKFSTAEKTKSHLRDALSRFNQVEGFSDELLAKAWTKLLMLCDHYGIDVAEKEQPRSSRSADEACDCDCDPCKAGNCEGCTVTDCDDPNCDCDASQGRSLLLRARAYIHAA
jgi:HK97 family phage prohead protease